MATATDVAHAEAECSNRGICNRKNGGCFQSFVFHIDVCSYLELTVRFIITQGNVNAWLDFQDHPANDWTVKTSVMIEEYVIR